MKESFRRGGGSYGNSATSPAVFQPVNMLPGLMWELRTIAVRTELWVCLLQGEELQLVREALRSLRDNFSGHDPQHHTLDTLEQGVSSLVDRLHSLESQRRQDRGVHARTHPRISIFVAAVTIATNPLTPTHTQT